MRILLVEGDPNLARAVCSSLRRHDYQVDRAAELHAAEAALRNGSYSAILLDVNLPDGDGHALLPTLCELPNRPAVIAVAACNDVQDRIRCLENGADDYLVKPYAVDELLARLRATQRRRAIKSEMALVQLASVEIDLDRREVRRDGVAVNLSPMEWNLLRFMANQPDRIHAREALAAALYANAPEDSSNTVEVFVSRLRGKVGRENIQTLRGLGYRLAHQATSSACAGSGLENNADFQAGTFGARAQ